MTTDTFVGSIDSAGGTAPAQSSVRAEPAESPPDAVRDWMLSPDARQYRGLWVIFDESDGVLDVDLSPTALRNRNPHTDGSVFYVEGHDSASFA